MGVGGDNDDDDDRWPGLQRHGSSRMSGDLSDNEEEGNTTRIEDDEDSGGT